MINLPLWERCLGSLSRHDILDLIKYLLDNLGCLNFLGLLVKFEGGKENAVFFLNPLCKLKSGEHLTFIDLPLHEKNKRLPLLHDAHSVGVMHQECLHHIKKVDAQIEFLIIQKGNGNVDLTSPLAYLDEGTPSNALNGKASYIYPLDKVLLLGVGQAHLVDKLLAPMYTVLAPVSNMACSGLPLIMVSTYMCPRGWPSTLA